ncbi:hypothetical protein SPHINGO8AM_70133 [Sphingomonas sp. 8AM]|nr:hypothetical protein SPHINGO8AM_70133 [Sphingomonas sp. 8AM]
MPVGECVRVTAQTLRTSGGPQKVDKPPPHALSGSGRSVARSSTFSDVTGYPALLAG